MMTSVQQPPVVKHEIARIFEDSSGWFVVRTERLCYYFERFSLLMYHFTCHMQTRCMYKGHEWVAQNDAIIKCKSENNIFSTMWV